MKALISNDDGITASGILAAKKAVDEFVLKGYEFIDKNVNDDIVY